MWRIPGVVDDTLFTGSLSLNVQIFFIRGNSILIKVHCCVYLNI